MVLEDSNRRMQKACLEVVFEVLHSTRMIHPRSCLSATPPHALRLW